MQLTFISTTVINKKQTCIIKIPTGCRKGMLIVLLDGGNNLRYYTSISITGALSNVKVIYDKGMPTSPSSMFSVMYQLIQTATFNPGENIEVVIGTSDSDQYYTTSKALLLY